MFQARRAVVIATGTRPFVPPQLELDNLPYWTNHQAIETDQLPRSLVVMGGGPVGVELAQVFARFGSAVTVVETGERLLPSEEPEAGDLLAEVLRSEGVTVHTGSRIASVRHDGYQFTVEVDGVPPVAAERLLVATGRVSDLPALGVESVGLDADARALPVDERLRVVGAERLWALGDVTGKGAFTHVSMYQADIVVADILGQQLEPADYRALPRVTFTDPEVGSVGMSERVAIEQGITVRTGMSQIPSASRGWIHKAGNQGFIKLVEDADRRFLVGATSAGPTGGEILGLLTLAVHARVPMDTLRHMMYAYPTFHRAVQDALYDMTARHDGTT